MGGKGGRVFRNNYKGHMDKTKGGGWKQGRGWGWLGWGGVVVGKCRQLYLNNKRIIKRKFMLKKKKKKSQTECCEGIGFKRREKMCSS